MENRLKVYLSYSLQDDYQKIIRIKSALEDKGFEVLHHMPNTEYKIQKLVNADFVLFVGNKGLYSDVYAGKVQTKTLVGKGQFTEAEYCTAHNKLGFILHQHNKLPDFFVSKICDEFGGRDHYIVDKDSWKKDYGYICSYSRGSASIDMMDFVEGHFGSQKMQKGIVLTEKNKLKQDKRKLLLLIGK